MTTVIQMAFSPIGIQILLLAYCSGEGYSLEGDYGEVLVSNSTAAKENLSRLISCSLVEAIDTKGVKQTVYRTTERGRVYVEAITSLPLPVQKWVME